MKPGDTGLTRIVKATGYSMSGLRAAWRREAAFRQELGLVAVMVPLGLWLGGSGFEKAVLVASGLFVLAVELLNSAIEAVVDRTGHEPHELARISKDLGSAAVFVSLLTAGVLWAGVALDRLAG